MKAKLRSLTGQIVEVEWLDAGSSGGWKEPTEHAKMQPLHTVSAGYLIHLDKTRCVLGQSFSDTSGMANDTIVIPHGMIRGVRLVGHSIIKEHPYASKNQSGRRRPVSGPHAEPSTRKSHHPQQGEETATPTERD